jgi:hypothetical protein
MVFPNLLKEQEGCALGIDGGMHRDEVCMVTLSMTFIIALYPWDSGSLTMKSTLIVSHGASSVSEGWSSPIDR